MPQTEQMQSSRIHQNVEDVVPLGGLQLPDGSITSGIRPKRTFRRRNIRMLNSLDISGKRILDIGCAEGLHSLYMAGKAREVVGVDHRDSIISVANATKEALNIRNVSFLTGDIRDHRFLISLGYFDLIIAWGIVHRIANVFQFFDILSKLSDSISLEWSAPVVPFMSRLSVAYHSTNKKIDLTNIDRCKNGKTEGNTGFWEPTPGSIKIIAQRVGFNKTQIVGYGENMRKGLYAISRPCMFFLLNRILCKRDAPQLPRIRVHMMLFKYDNNVFYGLSRQNVLNIPSWDYAMSENLSRGKT